MARRSDTLTIPVRVKFVLPTHDEAREGAKVAAIATVKLTPYGRFESRSCGRNQHSARKFAQTFVLQAVADAILKSAEIHEQVNPPAAPTHVAARARAYSMGQFTDEILRLGGENPLSDGEARSLFSKIADKISMDPSARSRIVEQAMAARSKRNEVANG